jgi:hypothetical protein
MATYLEDSVLLTMLKQSEEIITDFMDAESKEAKEAELLWYIGSAKEYIEREGINLEDTIGDAMLITMYALWLYDKRKTTGSKYTSYYIQNMQRMLRYNLNNRLFSQKVKE